MVSLSKIRVTAASLALAMALAAPAAAEGLPQLAARPATVPLTLAAGLTSLENAWAYRPSRVVARPPVLVMLHGFAQDPRDFIATLRSEADRRGYIILAPKSKGHTWDYSGADAYVEDPRRIDAALADLFRRAPADPERVAIAGFSDGASYALSLGIRNPQLFRGVLAFSPGFINVSGPADSRQRVFISHGRGDPVLPFQTVRRVIIPELEKAGAKPRTEWHSGGHRINRRVYMHAIDYVLDFKP